jgi:hypothetical protein
MRSSVCVAALIVALTAARPAAAASYTFDVLYTGGNNATLAPGSDDPLATTLVAGDTFAWDIKAQSGGPWLVFSGGDFFALMAFGVLPAGERIGDFTLTLSNGGSPVFADTETGVLNQLVHMGTNTISLPTGLVFDQMHLDYSLTSATDITTGDPTGSTPFGLLPIFGAPELAFPDNIRYGAVPEPHSIALLFFGAGAVGVATRKHRRPKSE